MLYDKIKNVCKEKGVSVSFVEKESGLSNGTISKWNKSSPTVNKLKAVANYFGVSIEYFLEEKEVSEQKAG